MANKKGSTASIRDAVARHNRGAELSERAAARLRESAEYFTFDLHGEEMEFILTLRGAKMCKASGVDPVPHVGSILRRAFAFLTEEDVAGDGTLALPQGPEALGSQEGFAWLARLLASISIDLLDDFAVILWWGCKRLQPDLSLEDVQELVTPGLIATIGRAVYGKIVSYSEGLPPSRSAGDVKKAEDEGPEKN